MKLFHPFYLLILLSSKATSTTSIEGPKYAKEGCNDTCGGVRIPFPFGIGVNCSVNKWYIVDCNSSKPYLSALNHLEVLGVDLVNQTVTVNTQLVSDCRNNSETMSINLHKSPFLFSKSHNKFVVEGCGKAFMMNHGSLLTGCFTDCHSNTLSGKIKRLGITCQTRIPHNLKSYTVNHTRLERRGKDGGCGSAFLVDKKSYDEGRFSNRDSLIPISLMWTLSSHDYYNQVKCCRYVKSDKIHLDLDNGTAAYTWRCSLPHSDENPYYLEGNFYLENGCWRDKKLDNYAMQGCNDFCGNVRIPYPFGIGANCSINKWYIVDCTLSTPYLSEPYHLEILGVDLGNQTVMVNTPMISDCSNNSQIKSIDLTESPFLFSGSYNKFVFVGCGNAVMMDNGSVLTRCSTDCHIDIVKKKNDCLGITCCQTTISHHLKSYTINITQLERHGRFGACGSAFLVVTNSYGEGKSFFSNSFLPTSLLWTLSESDYDETICYRENSDVFKVDLGNGVTVDSWRCSESLDYTSGGNPYLSNQYELRSAIVEECKQCRNSGGFCHRERIDVVDGLVYGYCLYNNLNHNNNKRRSRLGIILGISICSGVLFLVATCFASYKFIKITKDKRRRKRFFKRNGGLLLKQHATKSTLVDKTILFTSFELEKATNNFNENRILGRGGQGTVYKGMLVDGRIVAVKKSKIVDECQLEQFINEVVILSQVNHRNVVKLLGCCLETEVPLLVSEFISNGTLYDRMHNKNHEYPLSLSLRLQIATEIAGALAYLHSGTSIPIYHRDIKTTNILLDANYRAKVSDFGTSRFVSMDQTHLTTIVKGTFGYLDPEYFRSSQFTEKSDVYSFGVVLLELLTGERPISLTQFGESRSLAMHFMLAMEEGRVLSIFDVMVIKEGRRDELMLLANLATRCLNPRGKNRPTMKQVATELETIRTSHLPSKVQTSIGPVTYGGNYHSKYMVVNHRQIIKFKS